MVFCLEPIKMSSFNRRFSLAIHKGKVQAWAYQVLKPSTVHCKLEDTYQAVGSRIYKMDMIVNTKQLCGKQFTEREIEVEFWYEELVSKVQHNIDINIVFKCGSKSCLFFYFLFRRIPISSTLRQSYFQWGPHIRLTY